MATLYGDRASMSLCDAASGGIAAIASARETAESVVHFENVGMRYEAGPEVLSDISFLLQEGSFHFVTGASGAGKSSLLN